MKKTTAEICSENFLVIAQIQRHINIICIQSIPELKAKLKQGDSIIEIDCNYREKIRKKNSMLFENYELDRV